MSTPDDMLPSFIVYHCLVLNDILEQWKGKIAAEIDRMELPIERTEEKWEKGALITTFYYNNQNRLLDSIVEFTDTSIRFTLKAYR